MEFPFVHCVVLSYNYIEGLEQLLPTIGRTEVPHSITVYCDGPLNPQAYQDLQARSNVKFDLEIDPIHRGLYRLWNRGIRKYPNSWVTILNDDCTFEHRWLEVLLTAMQSDQKLGIGGFSNYKFDEYPKRNETGPCTILNPECIAYVGLYDERFYLFGADHDYYTRVHCMGWKIAQITPFLINHEWHKSLAKMEETPSTKGLGPQWAAFDHEFSTIKWIGVRDREPKFYDYISPYSLWNEPHIEVNPTTLEIVRTITSPEPDLNLAVTRTHNRPPHVRFWYQND